MRAPGERQPEEAFAIGIPCSGLEFLKIEQVELRANGSIRYLYCSGIETENRDQLRRTLSAAIKVLEPGGVIRVATADLDRVVYGYLLDWDCAKQPATTRADRLNSWRKNEKAEFLFNEEDLKARLEDAGFVDIWRLVAGASSVQVFVGREIDPSQLVLEARKPAAKNA